MKKFTLVLLVVAAFTVQSFAQTAKTEKATDNSPSGIIVIEEAVFPGGQEAFTRFLNENMKYPEAALEEGVSGTVAVDFRVETDGSLSNIKVNRLNTKLFRQKTKKDSKGNVTKVKVVEIRSSSTLEKEALRIVGLSPKWNPANRQGKPLKSYRTVYVTFRAN